MSSNRYGNVGGIYDVSNFAKNCTAYLRQSQLVSSETKDTNNQRNISIFFVRCILKHVQPD